MKKKKKKTLLWFLIILVVFLGAYFLTTKLNQNDAEKDTSIALDTMSADNIAKLAYTKDGKTYTFTKNADNAWKYDGDSEFPMDQDFATDMVKAVSELKASRMVTEEKSNFASYGLDPVTSVVTVYDKDGKSVAFNVGISNSVTGDYYLNIPGTDRVYMVDSFFGKSFSHSLNEMASKEQLPVVTATNATGFAFSKGDTGFAIIPKDKNDTFTSSYYAYSVQQNGSTAVVPADGQKVQDFITKAIENIYLFSVENYKATDDELKSYGLDDASALKYTWSYNETDATTNQTVPKQFTFCFGGKNGTADDDSTYLRIAGSRMVYLIYNSMSKAFLDAKASDFESTDLIMFDLNSVEQMSITYNGQTTQAKITQTTETTSDGKTNTKNSYSVNDKEIDAATFVTFYYSLVNLKKEGVLDKAPQTTSPAELSITYIRNTTDHINVTLELMPYDANFYLAKYQDGYYLVNRRNMEEITSGLDKLLTAAK